MCIRPISLPQAKCTSTRATDRHGRLLGEAIFRRNPCLDSESNPNSIPDDFIKVLLASEDQRFFEHSGVDAVAVASAALDAIRGTRPRGASTITMQLARLLWPAPGEGLLPRKAGEVIAALRLERTLPKRRILEKYLMLAPFGRAVGMVAASQEYFGKPPSDLALEESALLVSLLPAPSRFDPRRNLDGACARRDRLLSRLARDSSFAADAKTARDRPCRVEPSTPAYRARHALQSLPRGLGQVETTLDARLQGAVEAILPAHAELLIHAGATQAAAVVLDAQTSEVLALVGSLDFEDPRDGQLDGTRLRRHTGSALKPFLYVEALATGFSMETLIDDRPTRFPDNGQGFSPRNSDGEFLGRIRLAEALAWSRNVPAVRLAQAIGVARVARLYEEFGLEPLAHTPEWYGLGIAIGNAEARLIDVTGAYATLARGGLHLPVVLLPQEAQATPVADSAGCDAVLNALRDEATRELAFGPSGRLGFKTPVAVKTGTSSGSRDFWFFAVTERHVLGLWAGNFDASPGIADAVAMQVLAPVAREVLAELGTR